MLKNKLLTALVVSASLGLGGTAYAEGAKPSNPLGECGIGAAIFPKYAGAAVISNIIWDLGTTALTSATMSPESCPGVDRETAAFIIESYDSLVEDTAQGQGQYLDTLVELAKVDASEREAFIAKFRESMSELISTEGYSDLSHFEKAGQVYAIAIDNA